MRIWMNQSIEEIQLWGGTGTGGTQVIVRNNSKETQTGLSDRYAVGN